MQAIYQSNHASELSLSVYFNMEDWLAIKKQALENANSKCAICNKSAKEVNHLSYIRLGKEKPEDLQAVCKNHFNQLAKTI